MTIIPQEFLGALDRLVSVNKVRETQGLTSLINHTRLKATVNAVKAADNAVFVPAALAKLTEIVFSTIPSKAMVEDTARREELRVAINALGQATSNWQRKSHLDPAIKGELEKFSTVCSNIFIYLTRRAQGVQAALDLKI